MTQNFGFTGVLGKQAHSRLRNCFSSAAVELKDKSDSGIIEFSFLNRRVRNTAHSKAMQLILARLWSQKTSQTWVLLNSHPLVCTGCLKPFV